MGVGKEEGVQCKPPTTHLKNEKFQAKIAEIILITLAKNLLILKNEHSLKGEGCTTLLNPYPINQLTDAVQLTLITPLLECILSNLWLNDY